MKSLEEFFFCPFLKPLYLRNKHIDLSIFLHISKVGYVKLIKILLSKKVNYNKMVEPATLSALSKFALFPYNDLYIMISVI